VCACRLVTEDTVVAAIRAGAGSLLEVVRRSDAGTRCGACLPAVWRLLTGEQERAGTQP
jgi:NAD(P)H-nitrite reductase large subunit